MSKRAGVSNWTLTDPLADHTLLRSPESQNLGEYLHLKNSSTATETTPSQTHNRLQVVRILLFSLAQVDCCTQADNKPWLERATHRRSCRGG